MTAETCTLCPAEATTDYDDLPLCAGCLNGILEPASPLCSNCGQPLPAEAIEAGQETCGQCGEVLMLITRERPPPGASYAVGIGIKY